MAAEALLGLAGVAAEKLAVRARGDPVQGVQPRRPERRPAPRERSISVGLCRQAADQSGAQSSAVPVFARPPREEVPQPQDEAQLVQFAMVPQQQLRALTVEAQTEATQDAPQVRPLAAQLQAQLASPPAPRLMALLAPLAPPELRERPVMLQASQQEPKPQALEAGPLQVVAARAPLLPSVA